MINELIMCTIGIIGFITSIYFFIRNNKVHKFRIYIVDLIHSRACVMIDDGASHRDIFNLWDMLDGISYEEMLFSFKPLKMEYWFTEEELKLLGYESKRLD